jgi:hypothetical protein
LEADATVEIGVQGTFEGGDNLGAVLDDEFDAGIVQCEFDIVVACGTPYLQIG